MPFDARSGVMRHARAARQQGAHHRAHARRRLRRQVRLPLRGPHRRAGAQGRATRAPGVHAPRGVPRSRQAPRGHGHRDRERRDEGRHDHRRRGCLDHRQRRLHGRLRRSSPQLAAMHVAGPYKTPERLHRRPSASTRTTSRPARCARPPRRRPAGRSSSTPTRSRPRSAWIRSSSAAATASTPATRARRGRSTADRPAASASTTPRRSSGYGQELPEDEAIGVAIGWWPTLRGALGRLREAQRATARA